MRLLEKCKHSNDYCVKCGIFGDSIYTYTVIQSIHSFLSIQYMKIYIYCATNKREKKDKRQFCATTGTAIGIGTGTGTEKRRETIEKLNSEKRNE